MKETAREFRWLTRNHTLQPLDPYIVARSRTRVNLNTVSSLQLAVSNLLFCLEFRRIGNKLSKHLSHPYTPVIRLQGLLLQCTTLALHVEDLFSSSVVAASATTIEEHVLVHQQMHDPTRGDVARTRRSDKERSSCQVLFVSCPQVRCHENLNMSNKMCVCVVRHAVQTVLPVCSQQTRVQFCGCLKTEPKLLNGIWRVPTPVCDGHFP